MKKVFQAVVIATVVLGLSGCFNHLYTYGSGGNLNSPPKYDNGFVPHFFFGLIGEEHLDVKSICPTGNATVKDYTSFVDGLIAALVGIVFAPKAIEVYCETSTAELVVPPQTLSAIAKDPRTLEELRTRAPIEADRLAWAIDQAGQ